MDAWLCWARSVETGSLRISPIEPYLVEGQLLTGSMAWPAKASDLQRDPRYVLHSVITCPGSGEEELKPYESTAEAARDLRGAAAPAWWWLARPPDKAVAFTLRIRQAVFAPGVVSMSSATWTPGATSGISMSWLPASPAG